MWRMLEAIQQQAYYRALLADFQRTAAATMVCAKDIDEAFDSLAAECTFSAITKVLKKLPQWFDSLRPAVVDKVVDALLSKSKKMNNAIAEGIEGFHNMSSEDQASDIEEFENYHAQWAPVATLLGFKVPSLVEISNQLRGLVEKAKARSKLLALAQAMKDFTATSNIETRKGLVAAMSVPGVETTPLDDDAETIMEGCFLEIIDFVATWASEEFKEETEMEADHIPALLRAASQMHTMLGTHGEFSSHWRMCSKTCSTSSLCRHGVLSREHQ